MSCAGSDEKEENGALLDTVNAGLKNTTVKLRNWWKCMPPQSRKSRDVVEIEKEFGLSSEPKSDKKNLKKQD